MPLITPLLYVPDFVAAFATANLANAFASSELSVHLPTMSATACAPAASFVISPANELPIVASALIAVMKAVTLMPSPPTGNSQV